MKIRVNGEMREAAAQTLAELLLEMEYQDELVATAVNQIFVRKKDRAAVRLAEDDAVEILTPRQGG